MIKVKDLSLQYQCGKIALENISFSLKENSRCAILGANGAGKSSLLWTLIGLTNNTSGEIFFDNIKVEKNSALKIRKIASFVFQNSDDQLFFPTVIEDVSFGAINSGLNEESANTLSRKLLSDFGIAHLENSQNQRLSDGEKKKVAICASLASDPKILLLDEPSALLDPKSKRECASFLSTLNKTILLSTHDLDFALNACPLSIVLNKGKLIAFGKTSEILTDKNLLLEASLV